jgi:hypothetical protein
VDRLVQPRLNKLLGSSDGFSPDGSLGQAGRAAAFWAIAPTLLLAVAALCLLCHAGRLLDLACCMLVPRIGAPKRWAAEACVAFAFVILFMAWRTPQSAAPDAVSCLGSGSGCNGGTAASVLWPIGSTLRNVVLFGYDFGYDPASAGDLSETALAPLLPGVQPRR